MFSSPVDMGLPASAPRVSDPELQRELEILYLALHNLHKGITGGVSGGGAGIGTVQSVSVTQGSGFYADVDNPTTVPNIHMHTDVTGILKGVGGALVAAVAGVDYVDSFTQLYAVPAMTSAGEIMTIASGDIVLVITGNP